MEDIYLQHRGIMSVEEENMFWLLKKKKLLISLLTHFSSIFPFYTS